MRVTYKIHRRPIILCIEMDAYPSLEDRRRSHEWNASFLLDVPLDQSALATLYIFCHGSKMDTINIHHSDSLLPISPPPFILVSTRWSIFPGIYRDEKIIATNKKNITITPSSLHPATGRQNIFLETTNPIELGERDLQIFKFTLQQILY